jgi:dTDP-4-dehydrorhamnose reductase
MKVLVTGCGGQLGFDVAKRLQEENIECIAATRAEMDITNFAKTEEFILSKHPDCVIHCAAYTAVDKAEDDEAACRSVNSEATGCIARACQKIGAKLIYISTDYVFSGEGDKFYETDDAPSPLGVYGRTKLEGELLVKAALAKYFIVRISWVFGKNGKNFIKTMLRLAKTHDALTVVGDQIGSPTYTKDLAELLVKMAQTEKYGTYHATNEGICSWADFAKKIFELSGKKVKVEPIPSEQYPTRAKRPHNSRLSKKSLDEGGFSRLPNWEDALKRYLDEIKDEI